MGRTLVIIAIFVTAACGAPAVVATKPPSERLTDVAASAACDELRARGFQIESASRGEKSVIVVSRAAARWSFALGVESASDERGPKWVVRLTVFHEPGRELKGEIAPSAIVPGAQLDAKARGDLVRALGKRAADQFVENFD